SQQLLARLKRPAGQRLRVRELLLSTVDPRQVIQRRRHPRVVCPEASCTLGGGLQEFFSVGEPALLKRLPAGIVRGAPGCVLGVSHLGTKGRSQHGGQQPRHLRIAHETVSSSARARCRSKRPEWRKTCESL